MSYTDCYIDAFVSDVADMPEICLLEIEVKILHRTCG